MRATKRSIIGETVQRASLLLVLLGVVGKLSFAQHTTLYGAPQYQRSTNWWSALTGGSSGELTASPKIPAAGRPVSKTPHPAVARIIVPERKSAALGSGTLIAKTAQHGYLITNWHVVREAKDGALVVFANGTQAQGKIVRTDKDWDLALIQIPAPAIEPLTISSVVPKVGEQLWIAGYGSGEFLLQAGLCSQYLAPYPEWPLELVEVGAAARQGDSGGPIMNANGELAGVLFGQGEGYTMGSYGGRVLQFLNQVPDFDSPTRGTIAQLAAVRVPGTATPLSNTSPPQPTIETNRPGMRLVSNSSDRNSEQRYWIPERRQPTPPLEVTPQPSAANPAFVAATATPASNAPLALTPSATSSAPLSIYSLPKTPPTAPAVASQYRFTQEVPPQNSFVRNSSGNGMRSQANSVPNPALSVSLAASTPAEQHLSFEDFAGHTLADQAITGLWCLGGIFLLFKICGWLTRSGNAVSTKKSPAKRAVVRKPVLKAAAPRVQKNDLYSYDEDDDDDDDEEDEDDEDDE